MNKLAVDKLFVAGNSYAGGYDTRFSVVKSGILKGSRSSIILSFSDIIKNAGTNLSITDTRMSRFMITLEQGGSFYGSHMKTWQVVIFMLRKHLKN